MISIIDHIEYLLIHNDCVIVPGWGALIAQYVPASLDEAELYIAQPRRLLSFNESISHNDGLLASSIIRRHGVSFDRANQIIADAVALFKQQLYDGSEVSFGNIGYFTLNAEGHIEFMPSVSNAHCDNYYGLMPYVRLQSISNSDGEHPQEAEENGNLTTKPRHSQLSRFLKIAASIVLLLGLMVLLSTPIAVNEQQQNFAGLTIKVSKPKPVASQPASAPCDTTKPAQQDAQAKPSAIHTSNKKTVTATSEAHADAHAQAKSKYYLIVSAWNSRSQAQKFIKVNNVENGAVLHKGKCYYVYVDKGNNYNKLLAARNQVASDYPDAWICY